MSVNYIFGPKNILGTLSGMNYKSYVKRVLLFQGAFL